VKNHAITVTDDPATLPLLCKDEREYKSPVQIGRAVNEYAAEFADTLDATFDLRIITTRRRSVINLGKFLKSWHTKNPRQKFAFRAGPTTRPA
jgi:hypothetical protein